MSHDQDWTVRDSREAFLCKSADECLDVILRATPDGSATLSDLVEWALANDLRTATGICFYLSEVAQRNGLFATHSDNMNDPHCPHDPWVRKESNR